MTQLKMNMVLVRTTASGGVEERREGGGRRRRSRKKRAGRDRGRKMRNKQKGKGKKGRKGKGERKGEMVKRDGQCGVWLYALAHPPSPPLPPSQFPYTVCTMHQKHIRTDGLSKGV